MIMSGERKKVAFGHDFEVSTREGHWRDTYSFARSLARRSHRPCAAGVEWRAIERDSTGVGLHKRTRLLNSRHAPNYTQTQVKKVTSLKQDLRIISPNPDLLRESGVLRSIFACGER
jgi:hypothetical protein